MSKTTLAQQVTEHWQRPVRFVSADEPTLHDTARLGQQWEAARLVARSDDGLLSDC